MARKVMAYKVGQVTWVCAECGQVSTMLYNMHVHLYDAHQVNFAQTVFTKRKLFKKEV